MPEIDNAPLFQSYHGAIDWFRSRVPLTEEDARDLTARARERAFWAAGAATAAQTEALQESLGRAMQGGQSMDEWVREARQILTNSTARHLETVFRTNTQAAYSAARQAQMYAPAVLRRRPWGLVQTVDDQRRSKICTGFAGTLMPLDDPGWLTRTPPYHYNCRTIVRNLTDAQAQQLGGATGWPTASAQKGFGRSTRLISREQVAELDQTLKDVLEARRLQETIDPLTESPEVYVEQPRAVADAMRKINLDRTIRTPQALKRLIGVDRETFEEGAVSVTANDKGEMTISARNDRVQAVRTIKPDGTVFHDSLRIREDLRGQGLAKSFLKTAVAEYQKASLTKVELLADEDGKYVWPRLGFRAAPSAVEYEAKRFNKWLTSQGEPTVTPASMTDIAYHPRGKEWLREHGTPLHYEIGTDELAERLKG